MNLVQNMFIGLQMKVVDLKQLWLIIQDIRVVMPGIKYVKVMMATSLS
jgi:hypothetical protein